jgi:FlgD Ig-like domain
MKTHRFLACLAGALAIFLAPVSSVATYEVAYNYYCYATNSDGIPIMDNDVLSGESFVEGNYTKIGADGNYGTATFYADISTATISASAHSHGLQTGPYTFPSGTGRVERISFRDQLFFTVPPGYYPDNFEVGVIEVGIDESGIIYVDEDFVLTVELVAPETTLSEVGQYDESVTLNFRRGWASSNSYNPGGGNVIGDGDIDFTNGLKFVGLDVPPTVVCGSESGVFPSLPTSDQDDQLLQQALDLKQNYPNPFNPSTVTRFNLAQPEPVTLNIYNLNGHLVANLIDGEIWPAGSNSVTWQAEDQLGHPLPSGTYIYRLQAGHNLQTRSMVLVR